MFVERPVFFANQQIRTNMKLSITINNTTTFEVIY